MSGLGVGYLSNYFNHHAAGVGMVPMFDEAAPETTLLGTLAPDLDVGVEVVGGIDRFNVDINQNSAATLANNNIRPVVEVKENITTNKAIITGTIKQVQSEIIAATKLCGHDPAQVFPDNRMVRNEADLAGQGALTMLSGMPKSVISFAADAANKGTTVDSFLDDRSKAMSPAQRAKAIAQIEQKLVASSMPAVVHDTRTQSSSNVAMLAQPKTELKPSALNWKQFFEEGHKIDDLMAIDPDNIQPQQVPEYADLIELEYKVDEVHDNLQIAQNEAEENPELLPPHVQEEVDDLAFNPPEDDLEPSVDPIEVELVVQSLQGVSGLNVSKDEVKELSSVELEELKEQIRKLQDLKLHDEMKIALNGAPGMFSV